MEKFKVGDVVQLASGGPLMTVKNIATNGFVDCWWFASNEKPSSTQFPEGILIKVNPNAGADQP